MKRNDYNGWTNYETWNAKLWLDNDQGNQEYQQELKKQAIDQYQDDDPLSCSPRLCLADSLKEYVESEVPEELTNNPSMYTDLLNAAISNVNWLEIADNILSEDN